MNVHNADVLLSSFLDEISLSLFIFLRIFFDNCSVFQWFYGFFEWQYSSTPIKKQYKV